jgi:hypothetical protein
MKLPRLSLVAVLAALVSGAATPATTDPAAYLRGKWRIATKSYRPGPYAMDRKTEESLHGRRLEFSDARMSHGEQKCDSPRYAYRELSEEAFFQEYRCAPRDIGLKGKVVREISVGCDPASGGWPGIGDLALIKDAKTFLTLWDGVFLEVRRE